MLEFTQNFHRNIRALFDETVNITSTLFNIFQTTGISFRSRKRKFNFNISSKFAVFNTTSSMSFHLFGNAKELSHSSNQTSGKIQKSNSSRGPSLSGSREGTLCEVGSTSNGTNNNNRKSEPHILTFKFVI